MLAKPIPKEERIKVKRIQVLVHASGGSRPSDNWGEGGSLRKGVFDLSGLSLV